MTSSDKPSAELIPTVTQPSHKFADPQITANGEARASVSLQALNTLWLNTGTLCNLACESCYIESSPKNDALVYLSRSEVAAYLDEIVALELPVKQIGITGGEPFMNPDIIDIVDDCLSAGHQVLLLTNAMRPMQKCQEQLLDLQKRYPAQLELRVSVDHFNQTKHEEERGKRSWEPMRAGLQWLAANHFTLTIAGRTRWGESEQVLRDGYAQLFDAWGLPVDAQDPLALTLFPEMDPAADVPEITTACWGILDVDPSDLMCATARMVVKYKGAQHPNVVACTLLPYAEGFVYDRDLRSSLAPIPLNHTHCAKFCVLGGGSCSA